MSLHIRVHSRTLVDMTNLTALTATESRVIESLAGARQTVPELATSTDLSIALVRDAIGTLRRAGYVRVVGDRYYSSVGAYYFALTVAGEGIA